MVRRHIISVIATACLVVTALVASGQAGSAAMRYQEVFSGEVVDHTGAPVSVALEFWDVSDPYTGLFSPFLQDTCLAEELPDWVTLDDLGYVRWGLSPVSGSFFGLEVNGATSEEGVWIVRATREDGGYAFFSSRVTGRPVGCFMPEMFGHAIGDLGQLVVEPPASITGTVVDTSGLAVAGMEVVARPVDANGATLGSELLAVRNMTDANGEFKFEGLRSGSWRIDSTSDEVYLTSTGSQSQVTVPLAVEEDLVLDVYLVANYSGSPLPTSYDPRGTSIATPTKHQGLLGTCWAFAATTAAESNLARQGHATQLSPAHLVNAVYGPGSDADPLLDMWNRGGTPYSAALAMSRWRGPQPESSYPYSSKPTLTLPQITAPAGYHLREWTRYPWPATSSGFSTSNLDTLKEAIYTRGALAAEMRANSGVAWNNSTLALYHTTSPATNHAVALVGWNDNYPKTNFTVQPPGNGAFLAQDSGGQLGLNQGSYFWLSYYDTSTREASLFDMVDATTEGYSVNLHHDKTPGETMGMLGTEVSGATTYTLSTPSAKQLAAVSFVNENPFSGQSSRNHYEISVYKGSVAAPDDGTPLAIGPGGATSLSGEVEYPGIHHIPISQVVTVQPGIPFTVVVSLTHADGGIAMMGFDQGATNPGESWFKQTIVSPGPWTDTATSPTWGSPRIKAFMKDL